MATIQGNGAHQAQWKSTYEQHGALTHLWSIILAGGHGTRLTPMIKHWLGDGPPKQYCAFTGSRSMLQHTVDRADQLSNAAHRITVIDARHREIACRQLRSRGGRIVIQPKNCDTAPGVFLPLTYVRAQDPSATVVIYPSDHFVFPETRFVGALRHAVRAVELVKDRLVAVGIRPDRQELDYGYIRLDRRLAVYDRHEVWTVGRFIEKPSHQITRVLNGDDLLWNTMVIVAKVEQLWKIGEKTLPSMIRLFETFQPAINTVREDRVLSSLYESMPIRNFSTDILEHVPHRLAAFDMRNVLWSDWGRPERIVDGLRRIGKAPLFPAELAGVA